MSNLQSQLAALSDIATALEKIAHDLAYTRSKREDAIAAITAQKIALRYVVADVQHQEEGDQATRAFIRSCNESRHPVLEKIERTAPLYNKASRLDPGSDFD